MRYRLPPMNSLRAFEAVARLLSFSRAADELALSQGAVSRHIAILEDYLGVQLFKRTHREVTFTRLGTEYFSSVQEALDIINSETVRINRKRVEHPLRIKSLPTFAIRWLIPRLSDFTAAHPACNTTITTHHAIADFSSGDIDGSIEFGFGDWKNLSCDLLFHATLIPICSPVLADGRRPPRCIEDLRRHVLLHSVYRPELWSKWLEAAGADGLPLGTGTHLQELALVYQAAIDGLGIAMAELPYVQNDIAAGRLVTPFSKVLRQREAYYLVYPPEKLREGSFSVFRRWILEQAEFSRMRIEEV